MVRKVSRTSCGEGGHLLRIALGGGISSQGLAWSARVLTDVERRQVKSKSAHLAQKRIDHQLGQPLPAVWHQAFTYQPRSFSNSLADE